MSEEPGWWAWDAERRALVHRASGEEVRHLGQTALEGTSGAWPWHLFEYRHATRLYPLLVEVKPASATGSDDRSGTHLVWRLDHERSVALWRQRTNGEQTHPSFGLWRRVDYAATDALLSWPSDEVLGSPQELAVGAGWLNDGWHRNYYRRYFIQQERTNRPYPVGRHASFNLDAEPPRWQLTFGSYQRKWAKAVDCAQGRLIGSYVAPAQRHLRSARNEVIVRATYSPHHEHNFDGLSFQSDGFCATLKASFKDGDIFLSNFTNVIYTNVSDTANITGFEGITLLDYHGNRLSSSFDKMIVHDGFDEYRLHLANLEIYRHAAFEIDAIGSSNPIEGVRPPRATEWAFRWLTVAGRPNYWRWMQRNAIACGTAEDASWSLIFGE